MDNTWNMRQPMNENMLFQGHCTKEQTDSKTKQLTQKISIDQIP